MGHSNFGGCRAGGTAHHGTFCCDGHSLHHSRFKCNYVLFTRSGTTSSGRCILQRRQPSGAHAAPPKLNAAFCVTASNTTLSCDHGVSSTGYARSNGRLVAPAAATRARTARGPLRVLRQACDAALRTRCERRYARRAAPNDFVNKRHHASINRHLLSCIRQAAREATVVGLGAKQGALPEPRWRGPLPHLEDLKGVAVVHGNTLTTVV